MAQLQKIETDFKTVNERLRELEQLLFGCGDTFLDVFDAIIQLPDVVHCFFTVKGQHQPANANILIIEMEPSYILNNLVAAVRANDLNALLDVQNEILKINKTA